MPLLVTHKSLLLSTLLLPGLLCANLSQAAESDTGGFFGLGWLDQTQAYTTGKADTLAAQLDRVFGVERSDLEAAYSSLRFSTELRYSKIDGVEPGVRLRGKLYLPRINERISLIFSEDRGEGSNDINQSALLNDPQSTKVNLEINLNKNQRSRFDFRLGLRSGLNLHTSVRYRFEDPVSTNMLQRLTQTVYYTQSKGFGAFTQYQLDRELNATTLLRWTNELRTEQELDGVEWGTSLNHVTSYENNLAVSYFARMGGSSEQSFVSQYQAGMRVRRNIARPWLFIEVAPGYSWDKVDEKSPRIKGFFGSVRLEMAIGQVQ